MKTQLRHFFSLIAALAVGFTLIFILGAYLEKNTSPLPVNYEDEDLQVKGAKLKGYALGTEGLLADWYWMKSLQYIGGKIIKSGKGIAIDDMRELNPRLLYPYLDNAVTLDPKFTAVYEYGAVVLPMIDNDKAIELLEKGVAANPENWRLHHFLGFTYWKLKDFEKASAAYAAGADLEGAPPWMRLMVGKTKTDGGSRDTARTIYRQIYEDAADPQVKKSAETRLMQLDSLDEREAIRKALEHFKSDNNRCPANWREIFPALAKIKLPNGKDFRIDNSSNLVDPSGAPYLLESQTCDVRLDPAKTKITVE